MTVISIIVPVYNVESFLVRCLQSILNQTFSDFEVLLIDDGSTDNSASICKEFVADDQRFTYFHKTNGGLSSARNHGIERATGKYIAFLDSDDFIVPEFCNILYQTAELHQADVVNFGYLNIKNKHREPRHSPFPKNKKLHRQDFVGLLKSSAQNKVLYFAWTNFIRKELLDTKNIMFNENVLLGEDTVFNLELYMQMEALYSIANPLYAYVHNENSLTQKKYKTNLLDKFSSQFNQRLKIHKQHTEISGRIYEEDIAQNYIENTLFMLFSNIKNSNKSIENQLITLHNSDIYQFCLKLYTPSRNIKWKMRLKIELFRNRKFKILAALI